MTSSTIRTPQQRIASIADTLSADDLTSDDIKTALQMLNLRHLSVLSCFCTEVLYHKLDEIFNANHGENIQ